MIRTAHVGLGPIGLQIARATIDGGQGTPVAAVDVSADLIGRPLGELTGCKGAPDVRVAAELESSLAAAAAAGAQLAVVATGSRLPAVCDQIRCAVRHGLNVVSTSEELTWPWLRHPGLAVELDREAQHHGVTIVGTGINPGFLLDLLPLLLCRPCQVVERVTAKRIVNVSLRRAQLQRKVGSGLDPARYRELAAEGKMGHVGLGESAAMLAAGLGWDYDDVDEGIEPVVAQHPVRTDHVSIEPGQVMGSHQTARIATDQGKTIELICRMTHGETDPRDEIIVDGDPWVRMRIDGGIFGDTATAGCTVNVFRQAVAARPGLLTVKDLPVA